MPPPFTHINGVFGCAASFLRELVSHGRLAGAIAWPRAGVHHGVRHLVAATVVDDSDLLEVVAVEPEPPAAGLVANCPGAEPAQPTPELAAEGADVELGPALGV